MPFPTFRPILAGTFLSLLAACGTTFDVPSAGESSLASARSMFATEQATPGGTQSRLASAAAVKQLLQVAARVEPAAEGFCKRQTADRPDFDCDITIVIDDQMPVRNAYQTYGPDGEIVVALTLPMIADARNPHELAFVLGHEAGHHIGRHLEKSRQQAAAGALIVGLLTAYGQARADVPYDAGVTEDAMKLGAGIGNRAYSQTYELESDVIGTYITRAAGYDPVIGARFFARPEKATTPDGARSFWGTHPPDEKRLATVIETVARLDAAKGAAR